MVSSQPSHHSAYNTQLTYKVRGGGVQVCSVQTVHVDVHLVDVVNIHIIEELVLVLLLYKQPG